MKKCLKIGTKAVCGYEDEFDYLNNAGITDYLNTVQRKMDEVLFK